MAIFTLIKVHGQNTKEEVFRFTSPDGYFIEFLVLYRTNEDHRAYALKDTNASPEEIEQLTHNFVEVMRYAEFKRDPQPGFQLSTEVNLSFKS